MKHRATLYSTPSAFRPFDLKLDPDWPKLLLREMLGCEDSRFRRAKLHAERFARNVNNKISSYT